MKDKENRSELEGRLEGTGRYRRVEGGETIIRIYYVRKQYIFNKTKKISLLYLLLKNSQEMKTTTHELSDCDSRPEM